ncbi:hypothetical protein BCR34DRAFT_286438 [Clohesyomyces aquaticus]|uniref:Uncharacterized protein n=1 Tax=Clohesyomyces aquaticus TaxID=1231657 RepID=A0A1Y1ZS84_9PLEO|nr:hypothetical protein BCR34DRAFT_286438 [Clohesyomyces aquaticus]
MPLTALRRAENSARIFHLTEKRAFVKSTNEPVIEKRTERRHEADEQAQLALNDQQAAERDARYQRMVVYDAERQLLATSDRIDIDLMNLSDEAREESRKNWRKVLMEAKKEQQAAIERAIQAKARHDKAEAESWDQVKTGKLLLDGLNAQLEVIDRDIAKLQGELDMDSESERSTLLGED